MTALPSRSTSLVFRPEAEPAGDILVVVMLRGGMDGLHTVPPHGDGQLPALRPTLSQGGTSPGSAGRMIDLDGFYGLHSDLAPLERLYRDRTLAIVHACGSPDRSMSHFEAAKTIERGVSDGNSVGSGWLSRHLISHRTGSTSPLRGVSLSQVLPYVLTGAPNSIALPSASRFRFEPPPRWEPAFTRSLQALYAVHDDDASRAGQASFRLLRDLQKLSLGGSRASTNADYPEGALGRNLRDLAQLIRADVGLEVAVVESGGWDTHLAQAPQLSALMTALGRSLPAFVADLGERMQRVTVVVLSEFGRRACENSARGTDHGWATALFLLGGGIRGGRVYGHWPGLGREQLDANGNLQVTTDYRHVLAEIVERRLKNRHLDQVFPRFTPQFLDVTT
jgi:uncharacterized protein (DUF1501 family)